MTCVGFPEANTVFRAPSDLEESQCSAAPAYKGAVARGSVEGATIVVTAWQPSPAELEQLRNGGLVYLSVLGGLPPHFITTEFNQAINPA